MEMDYKMIEEVDRLKRRLLEIEQQAESFNILSETYSLKQKTEDIERMGKLIDQDVTTVDMRTLKIAVAYLKDFIARIESSEEYKQEQIKNGE